MNEIDTAAAGIKGVAEQLGVISTAMTIMLHPAFIAIVVNTGLLWAIEAFDRFLPESLCKPGTKEVDHRIRFVLAAVLTIPCMWGAMYLMSQPFRGANAGYALMSGFVGLAINALILKRIGLDLDKWIDRKQGESENG